MHERKVGNRRSAMFLREFVVIAVEPMPSREVRVAHHFCPEDLAILERGHHRPVQIGQSQPGLVRDAFQFRRKPPDAEFFFQQRIDSIERATRLSARNDQTSSRRAQDEPIRTQSGALQIDFQSRQSRAVAQNNLARLWFLVVSNDGQFGVREPLEVTLQFGGGILF